MISKEVQHAFEVDYRNVGVISSNSNGRWFVELFDGVEKKAFQNYNEAISFTKRKINIFQKGKQMSLSVSLEKHNTKHTHLLFPNSKTEIPYEVSDFYWNQIQVNVDPKQKAKWLDQFSPVSVSFNDVARATSFTNPRKIKAMTIFMSLAFSVIVAFLAIVVSFTYFPSSSTKVLSVATGMPYQSLSATILGVVASCLGLTAVIMFLMPFLKFYRHARDESGGFSHAGKAWKKSYTERLLGNWISLVFAFFGVVILAVSNAMLSKTVFFNFSIHSLRTWTMIGMLIAADLSMVMIFGIICGQIASTNNKRIIYLKTHIPPEDIDLFRSWTTHKRIESKKYKYDYEERFTYAPTMERLRVISEVVYPKKLRVTKKVEEDKKKKLINNYKIGINKYKKLKRFNSNKVGI